MEILQFCTKPSMYAKSYLDELGLCAFVDGRCGANLEWEERSLVVGVSLRERHGQGHAVFAAAGCHGECAIDGIHLEHDRKWW